MGKITFGKVLSSLANSLFYTGMLSLFYLIITPRILKIDNNQPKITKLKRKNKNGNKTKTIPKQLQEL
jgi:hypothetical protein